MDPEVKVCSCMVTREWTTYIQLLSQKVAKPMDEIDILVRERLLLEKILRKNRNQHSASKFYRKLQHVLRLLNSACKRMSIDIRDVPRGLKSYNNGMSRNVEGFLDSLIAASKSVTFLHERKVPLLEWGVLVLQEALEACELDIKLVEACCNAAKECCVQIAHSFFMPLSTACLAIVARVQVMAASIAQRHCQDYCTLVQLAMCLPNSKGLGEIEGLELLPENVRCKLERGKTSGLKIDEKNSLKDILRTDRNLMGIYEISNTNVNVQTEECCQVVEDHGQPVSREEVMRALRNENKIAEGIEIVVPAFESAKVTPLKSATRSSDDVPPRSSKIEAPQTHDVKKAPAISVKESVPALEKRDTAFIRIGNTSRSKNKEDKSLKRQSDSSNNIESTKSWEDWLSPVPNCVIKPPGPTKKKRRRAK
jgi:hypothetical protein